MDFLGESIICDEFLKFLVSLMETWEFAEFGIPPMGLFQAAVQQILLGLLSQLHDCHKLAVYDNISLTDA